MWLDFKPYTLFNFFLIDSRRLIHQLALVLFFQKKLTEGFQYFFVYSLFFSTMGILSTLLLFRIKTDCSLRIIKHLSDLGNNFFSETIVELFKKTIHVLVGGGECVHYWRKFFEMSDSILWYSELGRKPILSSW